MVLLITTSPRAPECAAALQDSTGEQVTIAASLYRAAALLSCQDHNIAVFDQHLLDAEPGQAETVMQHLGTASPLEMNLAISSVERLVREVHAALRRRAREQITARQAAANLLHSELRGTLTALLLQCELAQETPGLPAAAAENLRSAHELVEKLRAQLEAAK